MPALYPNYRCEVCGKSHALYYPGIGAVPDLSKPHYFTCPKLRVAMRVMGGGQMEAGEGEAGRGNRGAVGRGAWLRITGFAPSAQPEERQGLRGRLRRPLPAGTARAGPK